jgi:c-di-GMP-binding flagellar brake protein YcgR
MNAKSYVGIAKFEKHVDRRVHTRFLLNLPVEYYPLDSPAVSQGCTLNASQGGLMVCLREPLQKGQQIQLKVYFSSGAELFTIGTKAEVMWADPKRREDGTYQYGVKFVEISPENLNKLKGFLDSLQFSKANEPSFDGFADDLFLINRGGLQI